MKFGKIVFSAILFALVSMTLVSALHTSSVSMAPSDLTPGIEQDVLMKVTNHGGDPIIHVELIVPEKYDGTPAYIISEVTTPGGWEYSVTSKPGMTPYKITWETSGSGISSGNYMSFGFKVKSPSLIGDYELTVKTIDSKGSESIETSSSMAPFSRFVITGEPLSVDAGRTFTVTVKAYGDDGKLKTDYTGRVVIGSTDNRAVLPVPYIFRESDEGERKFSIVFKSVGDRAIIVTDESAGVSEMSDMIKIGPGKVGSIRISPDDLKVVSGTSLEFQASATDIYGNVFDVTGDVIWDIDNKAEGKWRQNVYTTEKNGVWSVEATFLGVTGATYLSVQDQIVSTPVVTPPVQKPTEIEQEPDQEQPIVVPIITAEMTIGSSETVTVDAGEEETLSLTVENIGNTDLTGVSLSYIGVSDEWVEIYPSSEDIEAGTSREFLVSITVPENVSETQEITITATSNEGASSEKEITLYAGTAPTGFLIGVSKNLLQMAVVIIAIATVVIIVWELWFRK